MAANRKNNTARTLVHWQDFRLQLFVEGIIIGLLSGLLIVLYRIMLEKAEKLRTVVYTLIKANGYWAALVWFLVLILIGGILGLIIKKEPLTGGSGIPQIKGVLLRRIKMNWVGIVVWKFIGGVLAIGAGLSLGREGPSVQLGGAIGQGVSRMLGRLRIEEKYLVTCGASAGLAAAFNAPLAGVIFALEELHKNFSPLVLTSAIAASLSADVVSQNFFGQKPIFDFHSLPSLPLHDYLYLIGLGILIGAFGVLFNRSLLKSLDIYDHITWLPKSLIPILPLMAAGFLGFVLPGTLGGGNQLIESISHANPGIKMLIILIAVKFLFTMVSYGSGVPGGIFLPLLVIGALAGDLYGSIIVRFMPLDAHYVNNFVVLAMAAYFTAIVKAPITGSILITEMTGSFTHLLSLITVSMTAYIVSDFFKAKPIYEELLERTLRKKGSAQFEGEQANKTILEIGVCLGSRVDGQRIKDLSWPPQCLLVGIRRGETELIPKGSTRIYSGDYLIVLTSEKEAGQVKNALLAVAGES